MARTLAGRPARGMRARRGISAAKFLAGFIKLLGARQVSGDLEGAAAAAREWWPMRRGTWSLAALRLFTG